MQSGDGTALMLDDALRPDWPAPPGVVSLMSTRRGGVSAAPFDSLNLRPSELGGPDAAGPDADSAAAIAENQRRFAETLGASPVWLSQVHGPRVVRLGDVDLAAGQPLTQADASISTVPGVACAVLVADCLPVLFCDAGGRVVGAAHAGWRGLAGGVLEATVAAMGEACGCAADELLAWLGPCIGPGAFEVGSDVLAAFGADPAVPDPQRFVPRPRAELSLRASADERPRWLANLPQLARDRLAALGVHRVYGGRWCTVSEPSRFYSFRRDGRTGRLAAAVALRC